MPQQSRFSAPDDDNFGAVDRKIADWLAAQPGVQSTKTADGHDFGALNSRLKVIENRLDNNVGSDPAKFLDDPHNADVRKAVLDYFKPAAQNPTTTVNFSGQMDDIILNHSGPQAAVSPATPAIAAIQPANKTTIGAAGTPQQSRFSAPDNDDFAAVDHKISDWLAAQPGVQSAKTADGHDFGALNTRLKVIENRLDNNVGSDPAKFLNDPHNADVRKAVLDYFKPAAQNPTTTAKFSDQMDDIISNHSGPQAAVIPAAPVKTADTPPASVATNVAPAAGAAMIVPVVAPDKATTAPAVPVSGNKEMNQVLMALFTVFASLFGTSANMGHGFDINKMLGGDHPANVAAALEAPGNYRENFNSQSGVPVVVAAENGRPRVSLSETVNVTTTAPAPVELQAAATTALVDTKPLSQWDATLTARNMGGFDSKKGAFGSDVELAEKGRLTGEVFQPTELANSQLTINPAPTAAPAPLPAYQPPARQTQQFSLA